MNRSPGSWGTDGHGTKGAVQCKSRTEGREEVGGRGRNPHRLWTLDVSINSAEREGAGWARSSAARLGAALPWDARPRDARGMEGSLCWSGNLGCLLWKKGRCYLVTREEDTQCS